MVSPEWAIRLGNQGMRISARGRVCQAVCRVPALRPAQQQTSLLEIEPSASSGLLALCFLMKQTGGNSRGGGIRQPGLGSLCLCWDPRVVGPALREGAPPSELPPPKTSQTAHIPPSLFASAPGSGQPLWL